MEYFRRSSGTVGNDSNTEVGRVVDEVVGRASSTILEASNSKYDVNQHNFKYPSKESDHGTTVIRNRQEVVQIPEVFLFYLCVGFITLFF